MKSFKQLLGAAGLVGASALLLWSAHANAEERRACFQMCKDATGAEECVYDAHAAREYCAAENACTDLREQYAAACFVDDRDEVLCDEARALHRDCVAPCRDEFHTEMGFCRELMEPCLIEQCGIELPEGPPNHRGPFGR